MLESDGVPVVYRFGDPGLRYLRPPPLDRQIRTLTPPAVEVAAAFLASAGSYAALADTAEAWFGQAVTEDDTTARVFGKAVEFEECDGGVRAWVRGREVRVETAEAKALLRHFCLHPDDRATGAVLKDKYKAIKNQTHAAKAVQEALDEAEPSAAGWFCTRPLRWAEGVRIVRRRER